ncbi:tRNA (adenosine(37)-N6)-threonylcarbamoyltransferase complex ATPase subunit type 1 TsaE [Candidatus Viridilinea mediisalina]|uniref:tRNA threonylcarbamoyladenosine biosynthesis protein TsaE n=1 Tax=Candidatus Viridilinea mediisalina TaxID=2024553 RepID=A0A2A6REU1_9CHLR|nr:tRNA (adenosine(37)-N6)-threonylcarbamoyltransferase complex ATPase subunit type 1 TsaE [Candidatus Viridilinea mediisalina]PDW01587.1 tRNA (adenosine(37)-N6)-threonylcarbamoyltransferase complex ATPase subunit type 1 TsaE [Candidatus Viridilinea mediisalina]
MSDQRLPAVQAINQLDFMSHSPAQTERVGQRLGEQLQPGDLVLLIGTFGVGKTHLVKGLARGLGADDLVTSPSFVLVNEYRAGPQHQAMPIYHVDLYRLAETAELATLGLEELWAGDGICLIEWPERVAQSLPAEHLAIHIQHLSETKRRMRLAPHGPRYVSLVGTFKGTTFG